ncbi:MAG: nucleotidyltransferase family protein [Chloroflexota bacterium]|nr:MAG: nucleotidyltransferase family protein [Chloroflexota bacterium]
MIAGIILAAGQSTRMGSPKASLPWQDTTLLAYQIRELGAVVDDVIVVLGHEALALEPIARASSARVVVNERYATGRASSIAAGAAAILPETRAIIMIGVDQPRPREVFRHVAEAVVPGGAVIARAIYRGAHGHPTAFAASLLDELRAVEERGEGMKSLLRGHAAAIVDVECDDPIVLVNLNTREEYEASHHRFGRRRRHQPGSHDARLHAPVEGQANHSPIAPRCRW